MSHSRQIGAHVGSACRDQKMTANSWWQEGGEQIRMISIIQDQQPLSLPLQPVLHGLNHDSLFTCVFLWQIQQASNVCKRSVQRFYALGVSPQHGVILVVIAIGILDRKLRFANPTQTTDTARLTCNGGRSLLQLLMKLFQLLIAPRKKRIALVWEIPMQRRRV